MFSAIKNLMPHESIKTDMTIAALEQTTNLLTAKIMLSQGPLTSFFSDAFNLMVFISKWSLSGFKGDNGSVVIT